MARGGGSAGTLTVTVGADTKPLDAGFRDGQRVMERFQRSTVVSNQSMVRSWEALHHAQKAVGMGAERFAANIGRMAAGLTMLGGTANSAASTIGGALQRSLGAFMVGGPLALGFQAVTEAVGYFSKTSASGMEKATDRAERYNEALKEMESRMASIREKSSGRALEMRAAAQGLPASFVGERETLESTIGAKEMEARLSRTAMDQFAMNLPGLMAAAEPTSVFGEGSDPYAALRAKWAELVAANKKAEEDLATARARLAEITGDREREENEKTAKLREAHEEKVAELREVLSRRLASSEREIARADAERAQAALERHAANLEAMRTRASERGVGSWVRNTEGAIQRGLSADESSRRAVEEAEHRLRLMQAESPLARAMVEHERERAKHAGDAAASAALERLHAAELAAIKRQQLQAENDLAAAKANAAAAAERELFTARAHAELDRRAEAHQARMAQLQAYGAGYGPLAQARDRRRRDRSLAKALRTEANLAAEASTGSQWRTIGAPRFNDDGSPIGVADPWASDLGSVYSRFNRPVAPVPLYQAPGLNTTPPPAPFNYEEFRMEGGPWGGGKAGPAPGPPTLPDLAPAAAAMQGAGSAAAEAARATEAAAGAAASAAQDISSSVAGVGAAVVSIAEILNSVKGDVEALKAQLEAAGYFSQ